MDKLHDQLAADLCQALAEYRAWKTEVRRDHGQEGGGRSHILGTIPLINISVHLVPLLDHQNWSAQEIQNPERFGLLKQLVKKWLSKADDDNRIAGRLMTIFQDEEKFSVVAELLMLLKVYPSRADIVSAGPGTPRRRGSLREQMEVKELGREPFLLTAIEMLLEFLEIDLCETPDQDISAQTFVMFLSSWKTKKAHVHLIWRHVDLDGDGVLSKQESRELCRLILSRASLGRLLITAIRVNSTDPDLIKMKQKQRAFLISIIPSMVLSFAKSGVESIAESFWLSMDKDKDGEVTSEEFCELFLDAIWNAIVLPLKKKVEVAWRKQRESGISQVPFGPKDFRLHFPPKEFQDDEDPMLVSRAKLYEDEENSCGGCQPSILPPTCNVM